MPDPAARPTRFPSASSHPSSTPTTTARLLEQADGGGLDRSGPAHHLDPGTQDEAAREPAGRITGLRILHVTEAFGAGTAAAIRQYVASLPQHQHFLAFNDRREAPVEESTLVGFDGVERLPECHLRRILALRTMTADDRFDIVHAHSSFAGTYSRLARSRRSVPIVYTPHCLAFERRDLSRPVRAAIRTVEALLSPNTSVIAGCSPFETAAGARLLRTTDRAVYVPNVSGGVAKEAQTYPGSRSPVRLLGIGRIAPQKDPRFFAETFKELRRSAARVDAVWIGDGDPALRAVLESAGVEVTGWRTFSQTRAAYSERPSIYLHTARWEGFPLSILESAVAGLPAVIRSLDLYEGLRLPGPIRTPQDAAADITTLISGPETWRRRVEELRSALADNTSAVQAARLQAAYERAIRE